MGSVQHYILNKTRKMSGLTDEWQLKTSENSIKYMIDIEKFDKKIKSFRTGRDIHSKNFKLGRSTLCIKIYPAGQSAENKGFVSVYIYNKNEWRIKAKATISIEDNIYFLEKIEDFYLQSGSGLGFPTFIPHDRCTRDDLLSNCGGTLTLQVELELLQEEVLPHRDLTKENTIERVEELEQTVNNLQATIEKMEAKSDNLQATIKKMDAKSTKQTNELKKMIQDLTLAVSNKSRTEPSQPRPSLEVECPVCMEVAKPPMRLKQCGQGHIICDTCHARAEEEADAHWDGGEGNPDIDLCHTCREVITGRPTELERVLGLTLPL